jgi:Ca2+-binding RTX toxin-like protein
MWFHGLTGSDSLQGGEGSDTYYYNRGEGQDTVLDIGVATGDSIRFGAGILATQVSVSRGTGGGRDDRLEAANAPTFKMAA